MDDARFDAVTRAVARLGTRRAALRVLGGVAGASLLAGLGQRGASSARCKNLGRKCDKNRDCCDGRCKRGKCRCTRDTHCKSSEYCKRGRCKPRRCPNGSCRVFLASTRSNANLGGLTGADATCQRLADEAELGGTYRAWLSDDTGSPATRFSVQSPDPYVLVDDTTIVANDWDDLTDGSIQSRINMTETDEINNGVYVWTNTAPDGTVSSVRGGLDCQNWTSGEFIEGEDNEANVGSNVHSGTDQTGLWTADPLWWQCSSNGLGLFCFEQD